MQLSASYRLTTTRSTSARRQYPTPNGSTTGPRWSPRDSDHVVLPSASPRCTKEAAEEGATEADTASKEPVSARSSDAIMAEEVDLPTPAALLVPLTLTPLVCAPPCPVDTTELRCELAGVRAAAGQVGKEHGPGATVTRLKWTIEQGSEDAFTGWKYLLTPLGPASIGLGQGRLAAVRCGMKLPSRHKQGEEQVKAVQVEADAGRAKEQAKGAKPVHEPAALQSVNPSACTTPVSSSLPACTRVGQIVAYHTGAQVAQQSRMQVRVPTWNTAGQAGKGAAAGGDSNNIIKTVSTVPCSLAAAASSGDLALLGVCPSSILACDLSSLDLAPFLPYLAMGWKAGGGYGTPAPVVVKASMVSTKKGRVLRSCHALDGLVHELQTKAQPERQGSHKGAGKGHSRTVGKAGQDRAQLHHARLAEKSTPGILLAASILTTH